MKIFLTYGDENFNKQKKFALKMAKLFGKFEKIIGYQPSDIDSFFYETNKHILDKKRGGGYWLWKPYFINRILLESNFGDYIFYSDAGAFFLKSVDVLISVLKKLNQDIMGFELPLIESQWTKKELFMNMNCDEEKYYESNQILASFMLIRKTEFSMKFFKEYLELAQNEMNITDNFDSDIVQREEFIDHRHDQSIFSLLYKKYGLIPFKDPSQLGKYPAGYSASKNIDYKFNKLYILNNGRKFRHFIYFSEYENVIYLNKKGKPLKSYIKFKIKEFFFRIRLYKGLVR